MLRRPPSSSGALVLVLVLVLILQSLALRFIVVAVPLDDSVCIYDATAGACLPTALCEYHPQAKHATKAPSCRMLETGLRRPQQLHLAYAGTPTGTGMTISWATYEPVKDSVVWIGSSPDDLAIAHDVLVEIATYFSDDGYSLYQNHAAVLGLVPHTTYYYQVGSASNASLVSAVSSFATARGAIENERFTFGVYGDLGFGNLGESSIAVINTLVDELSFVLHVGDIAYADDAFLVPEQVLYFFYEKAYNAWMNLLTPIMSRLPYMVTVGNHEAECHSPACFVSKYKKDHLGNYSAYNARFRMPSRESKGVKNMWYSFEYGPVHFTTISSETDYLDAPSNAHTLTHKNGQFGDQLAWLEADLRRANATREQVPWLVVTMHRPIYHRKDTDRMDHPTGDSRALQLAFEELFIKYDVDLVIAGHEHAFERQLPIAHSVAVMEGVSTDRRNYVNPQAPVYIVTGGPGNIEENKSANDGSVSWSVLESVAYGINTVQVSRNTLDIQYIATTASRSVLDEFSIIKVA